jgi:hypothetical protein
MPTLAIYWKYGWALPVTSHFLCMPVARKYKKVQFLEL